MTGASGADAARWLPREYNGEMNDGRFELTVASECRPAGPQVTLVDFILSTAFLGAGVGCFIAAFQGLQSNQGVWSLIQFIAGGPFIGAGLLTPFHRPRLGAYLGFFGGIVSGVAGLIVIIGPEVLWDLRYVIGFTLVALVAATISILQKISQRLRDT